MSGWLVFLGLVLLLGSINAGVNFGVMMAMPLMLGRVYGLDAGTIGLLLFPGALAAAVVGYGAGTFIDGKGPLPVMAAALTLTGSGLLLLSALAGRHPLWPPLFLVLTNAGYMCMQPALAKWVSASLPDGRTGIGMGVYSLNNFMSTALFGALVARTLESGEHAVGSGVQSGIYGNVFLGLFLLVLIQLVVVLRMRPRASRGDSRR